jgi:hypothetical protein
MVYDHDASGSSATRRRVLAGTGAVAGLSGCAGNSGQQQQATASATQSATDSPTESATATESPVKQAAEAAGPSAWVRAYQTDDGTAYAEGRETTYEGEDVLDAIQQAIDAKLEAGGFIHVEIEPGLYPVSNSLQVTQKGPVAVSIESPSTFGAYLQTRGGPEGEPIPEGETVLNFNPEAGGSAGDRAWGIEVRGVTIDDREGYQFDDQNNPPKAHPTTAGAKGDSESRLHGLYINDCRHAIVDRFVARQFRTAIRFENVWQGEIDYPLVAESGHEPTESPSVQIIGGDSPAEEFPWTEWTDTQNANNHIQINHMQGHGGSEYTFFETRRAANTQCEISFANLELQSSDWPGLKFGPGGSTKWIVRGCFFKGGSPSIRAVDGAKLVVGDCYQEKSGQLLSAEGGRVVVGNCMVEGSSSEGGPDVIAASDCVLNVSNVWAYGGGPAVNLENSGRTTISNCTFNIPRMWAMRIRNPNSPQILSNLHLSGVGTSGTGHGVEIVDSDQPVVVNDTIVDNDGANEDDAAVRIHDSTNVHVGQVVPWTNVAEKMTESNS